MLKSPWFKQYGGFGIFSHADQSVRRVLGSTCRRGSSNKRDNSVDGHFVLIKLSGSWSSRNVWRYRWRRNPATTKSRKCKCILKWSTTLVRISFLHLWMQSFSVANDIRGKTSSSSLSVSSKSRLLVQDPPLAHCARGYYTCEGGKR